MICALCGRPGTVTDAPLATDAACLAHEILPPAGEGFDLDHAIVNWLCVRCCEAAHDHIGRRDSARGASLAARGWVPFGRFGYWCLGGTSPRMPLGEAWQRSERDRLVVIGGAR